MIINELINHFAEQSSKKKILFLSLLAHDITVRARDTYIVGSTQIQEPLKLRAFNEIQHQITGQLIHFFLDVPIL